MISAFDLFDKAISADDVLKGDYVGHPFRGNQWADSTGASTSGATSSAEIKEPVKFSGGMGDDGAFELDEQGMLDFVNRQHGDTEFTTDESGAAIDYASVFWFEDINNTLRMQGLMGGTLRESADSNIDANDLSRIEKDVKTIDGMMAKATLTDDVVTYRGVTDEDGTIKATLESEGGLLDHAYQSTSLNPIVAASAAMGNLGGMGLDFANNGLIMEILIPKGTHALAIDKVTGVSKEPSVVEAVKDKSQSQETGFTFGAEILLPRGTILKVTGKRTDPEYGEIWQVTAEETTG